MRNRLQFLNCLILSLAVFISIIFVLSMKAYASTSPTISYTVDTTLSTNSTYNIYINSNNYSDLYGASVKFNFDNTMFQVISVQPGTAFNGLSNLSIPINTLDNSSGTGSIMQLLLGDCPGINGSGTIAVVTVKALKLGQCNYNFMKELPSINNNTFNCSVQLSNSSGSEINYDSNNYSYNYGGPALASSTISDTIPTSMEPGKSYNVSVTLKNIGTTPWNEKSYFRLGAIGDSDPFYASNNRVLMNPSDTINTNDTITFNFVMTAPNTEGIYTSDWQMVQDGVTWFGDILTKQISVKKVNYISTYVSDTIPTSMEPGKAYNVSVTFKNSGLNPWSYGSNYRLGAIGDSDPFYTATNRVLMNPSDAINTNDTVTFNFVMTAPNDEGTYISDWRMVQDGVTWFGDTLTKQVSVKKIYYGAKYISDTIPTSMEPGKSYNVSVTFKNSGLNPWSYNSYYRLGAVGDSDPFYTAANRVLMNPANIINTNGTITFSFLMTAPNSEGTYISDWRMVQDGVTWFGDTLNKQISVKKLTYLSNYVSDTIPTAMQPGKSYNVSVTFKNTGLNPWSYSSYYRLGAVGDSDPFYTVTNRVLMNPSDIINTNNTVTFNFIMTAPNVTGTYVSDWRMVEDGFTWFGDTLTKQILVTN